MDLGEDRIHSIAVRVLEDKRQIWLFLGRDVKILEEPLAVSTQVPF